MTFLIKFNKSGPLVTIVGAGASPCVIHLL